MVPSQVMALQEDFSIQGFFRTMKVSASGDILLISDNTVHKVDRNGFTQAMQSFDGKRPLALDMGRNEILFFMEGNDEVRILDPNLAPRRKINLAESGIENPGPAARADREEFWIFDKDRGKFLLVSHNMKVRRESDDLTPFAFQSLNPVSATYYDNKLFVNNGGHEVLVLDRFGSYEQRLDVRADGNLQIADGKIFFVKNNRARVMDIRSGRDRSPDIVLPYSNIREYLIKDSRVYILTRGGLTVFNI